MEIILFIHVVVQKLYDGDKMSEKAYHKVTNISEDRKREIILEKRLNRIENMIQEELARELKRNKNKSIVDRYNDK